MISTENSIELICNKIKDNPMSLEENKLIMDLINNIPVTNINEKNYLGWTAMHYACRLGNIPIILHLQQNGAEIDFIETPNGSTAFSLLTKYHSNSLDQIIKKKEEKVVAEEAQQFIITMLCLKEETIDILSQINKEYTPKNKINFFKEIYDTETISFIRKLETIYRDDKHVVSMLTKMISVKIYFCDLMYNLIKNYSDQKLVDFLYDRLIVDYRRTIDNKLSILSHINGRIDLYNQSSNPKIKKVEIKELSFSFSDLESLFKYGIDLLKPKTSPWYKIMLDISTRESDRKDNYEIVSKTKYKIGDIIEKHIEPLYSDFLKESTYLTKLSNTLDLDTHNILAETFNKNGTLINKFKDLKNQCLHTDILFSRDHIYSYIKDCYDYLIDIQVFMDEVKSIKQDFSNPIQHLEIGHNQEKINKSLTNTTATLMDQSINQNNISKNHQDIVSKEEYKKKLEIKKKLWLSKKKEIKNRKNKENSNNLRKSTAISNSIKSTIDTNINTQIDQEEINNVLWDQLKKEINDSGIKMLETIFNSKNYTINFTINELANFIQNIGGKIKWTNNNHMIYKIPNIYAQGNNMKYLTNCCADPKKSNARQDNNIAKCYVKSLITILESAKFDCILKKIHQSSEDKIQDSSYKIYP